MSESIDVLPRALSGAARLVELAEAQRPDFEAYPRLAPPPRARPDFDPYRDTDYEEHDRYHVLPQRLMKESLLRDIFQSVMDRPRPGRLRYVQINRYDRGDYVLPHRDDCQQTIYMLTSSERDGLVVEAAEGHFVRILDSAGQSVTHPPEAWHWVEPVLDPVRYTLVTIWDEGRRA